MNISEKQIAAMAIAAIAEEIEEDVSTLRVISFKEIPQSSLEYYLKEKNITFKKYQLGDELV